MIWFKRRILISISSFYNLRRGIMYGHCPSTLENYKLHWRRRMANMNSAFDATHCLIEIYVFVFWVNKNSQNSSFILLIKKNRGIFAIYNKVCKAVVIFFIINVKFCCFMIETNSSSLRKKKWKEKLNYHSDHKHINIIFSAKLVRIKYVTAAYSHSELINGRVNARWSVMWIPCQNMCSCIHLWQMYASKMSNTEMYLHQKYI